MSKMMRKLKNSGKVFEEFDLSVYDAEQADILESYVDMTIGEIFNLSDMLKDGPVYRTLVALGGLLLARVL